MGKVELSSIFRGDYFRTASSHIKRLQNILSDYDVVIFMARKAICFYEALKNNGEITNTNCRIVSSRIVYYNTLNNYKDKKIAVVDDVVVRGRSINRVASTLKTEGLKADYFVAACEENFLSDFECNNSVKISTHVTYTRSEIYHFSGLITQYIEASMRTFNVDSPVYEIANSLEDFDEKLQKMNAISLTSGLQEQKGIKSRSIYFRYDSKNDSDSSISRVLKESIIKIRFYNNDSKTIAVPFVLLPECECSLLEDLYQIIRTPELDGFITYGNERRIRENKYKIISYFLSNALFCKFAEIADLQYTRDCLNDIIQFDKDLDDILNRRISGYLLGLMDNLILSTFTFSRFRLSEYVKKAYSFVMKRNPDEQEYEDAKGCRFGDDGDNRDGKLGRIAFSFTDIFEWIKEQNSEQTECFPYVSSIIDIFVDTGFIVPAILHKKNEITLRAYKMGEYSKLSKDQINAFTCMLYTYQTTIDRYMDKIEIEKLCVLFFRELTKNTVFAEKTSFEEGDYCIAYSFYGPRISTSEELYTVKSGSTFIGDLNDEEILMEYKKKYYLDHEIPVDDEDLTEICYEFADVYADLNEIFKKHPYVKRKKTGNKPEDEHWNQYVHTLNQFLTLLAIGKNIREQILSLCAEIKLITLIDEDMFLLDVQQLPRKKYKRYLSGINSGLWKYRCYKGKAISQTLERIRHYNPYLRKNLLYSLRGPANRSKVIANFLDDCGNLLYEAAFVINEFLKLTNRTSDFSFYDMEESDYYSAQENTNESEKEDGGNDENKNDDKSEKSLAFEVPNYYFRAFENKRNLVIDGINASLETNDKSKIIKDYVADLQGKAKNLLDKCDLYLLEESINRDLIEDFLVVHSESAKLPAVFESFKTSPLEEVSQLHVTEVFPIMNPEDLESVVESVIYQTNDIDDCEYLLVHQKGKGFGYSYTEHMAKGTSIKEELKEIIADIHNIPKSGKYIYVYQKSDEIYTEFGQVRVKKHQNIERKTHGFLFSYSILPIVQERNMAPVINTNEFNGTIVVGDKNAVGENSSVGATNIESGAQVGISSSGVDCSSIVNNPELTLNYNSADVLEKIAEIRNGLNGVNSWPKDEIEYLRTKLDELEKQVKSSKPNKKIIDGIIKGIGFLRDYAELGVAIAALIQLFTLA